jgi:hypothetical protein
MSNKINDGGQAFPRAVQFDDAFINGHGMTLRDYFAAAALQGLMGRVWGEAPAQELFKIWVKSSYAIADAMLREREAK